MPGFLPFALLKLPAELTGFNFKLFPLSTELFDGACQCPVLLPQGLKLTAVGCRDCHPLVFTRLDLLELTSKSFHCRIVLRLGRRKQKLQGSVFGPEAFDNCLLLLHPPTRGLR